MVIGLLAVAAIPTITGVGNAISAQKRQNASSKEQEKFQLTAMLPIEGELREAAFCVLVDGKVRITLHETHDAVIALTCETLALPRLS